MRTRRCMKCTSMLAVGVLVAMTLACGKPQGPEAPPKPTPTKAAVVPSGPQKTVAILDPMAVAVPDVAVVVRINPLGQILSKVEALATQISPGITADTIKSQLGNLLADPALSGLDLTRPMMVLVFDPAGAKEPSAAGLLPVTSDQYKTKFQARGMTVYQKEGGKTLLIAENEAAAVAGRQAFDQLEGLMAKPMASDINVYANVEMLMSRHGADIDMGINQMIQTMDQMQKMGGRQAPPAAGMSAMLGLEMRAIVSVIKDLKDVGVDISIGKDGLDLGSTLRAKPGTALAGMLDDRIVPDTSVLGYVPGTGAVIGFMGGDNNKTADFLAAKIDEVFAATSGPAVAKVKRVELKALMERTIRLTKGTAFDLLGAGGSGINGVTVAEVSDPVAYMNELKNMPKTLEATGIIALYKDMGMDWTMAFKENVRNYGGVPIHQMITDMTMPQMMEMPPMMMGLMKNFMHQEYEIAVVGNHVITDIGAKKMDAIIDAVKAKKPLWTPSLNAQSVFPKEGSFYCDILPGRLAGWILQIAQPMLMPLIATMGPEGEAMMAKIKALETKPISMAMLDAQGKLQVRLTLPIDPIVKIRQIVTSRPAAPPKAL